MKWHKHRLASRCYCYFNASFVNKCPTLVCWTCRCQDEVGDEEAMKLDHEEEEEDDNEEDDNAEGEEVAVESHDVAGETKEEVKAEEGTSERKAEAASPTPKTRPTPAMTAYNLIVQDTKWPLAMRWNSLPALSAQHLRHRDEEGATYGDKGFYKELRSRPTTAIVQQLHSVLHQLAINYARRSLVAVVKNWPHFAPQQPLITEAVGPANVQRIFLLGLAMEPFPAAAAVPCRELDGAAAAPNVAEAAAVWRQQHSAASKGFKALINYLLKEEITSAPSGSHVVWNLVKNNCLEYLRAQVNKLQSKSPTSLATRLLHKFKPIKVGASAERH